MRIKYEDEAKADLIAIGEHYREIGGNQLARRMLAKIKSDLGVLSDFSDLAPLYEIAIDIRRLVVADGTYLVFYRVTDLVQILHVRRGEREPFVAPLA